MALCLLRPPSLSSSSLASAPLMFPCQINPLDFFPCSMVGLPSSSLSDKPSNRRRMLIQWRSSDNRRTKLVTFVGKGGVGKTFSAVFAAQYYASTGLRTCLLVQSQDSTADLLLGQKLSSTPASFRDGTLTALRLETTKMLVEPLAQFKKADARLNFSQGALDEVVSEELSVLPGVDSLLALGALERLAGFAGGLFKGGKSKENEYDIIVYDGPSSEEIFRMFGSAERARWYLRQIRTIAEKTDAGRVALPSMLRLLEGAFLEEGPGDRALRSTAEIWETGDRILSRVVENFHDLKRFSCFLVTNPSNKFAVETALRYWGCATQAGVYVSGTLYPFSSPNEALTSPEFVKRFAPLRIACVPLISFESTPDWDEALGMMTQQTREVLDGRNQAHPIPPPVAFDRMARTVTLFLPGFHKSDVKLLQCRGGSELLVEAGDQRRIIVLPADMRGKVTGAKFQEKSLVVTLKGS